MSQISIAQNIELMIGCNCPMVFYYAHSRPELKRIVLPINIVGKNVVCVESDTGKRKLFKLDGIQFPPEDEDEKKLKEMERPEKHEDDDLNELINSFNNLHI